MQLVCKIFCTLFPVLPTSACSLNQNNSIKNTNDVHKGGEKMKIQCVILVASATLGQRLESLDKKCDEGFSCKPIHLCPLYQEKIDQLTVLRITGGVEYENLLSSFKQLICNQAENGICCEEKFEIVNGQVVRNVEEMPFIARIHLKTGPFTSSFCGATIIASQFLLTAKHCLTTFWDYCIEELDCVAHFRDLVRGRENHEKGQFYVPIVDIYERPGRSDDEEQIWKPELSHGEVAEASSPPSCPGDQEAESAAGAGG